MPYVNADGVRLYYEEAGSGTAIVFVHEFATDHRGWEPQMRYFSRRYRCVAFNARGYPPSDVPDDPEAYSQMIATDDIAHVMRHLGIEKAHVVGLSMGANAALQFGLDHAGMALSLVVAGGGYGSMKEVTEQFRADARGMAECYEQEGAKAVAEFYSQSPSRVQYRDKDPRGWAEFREILEQHDAKGAALTMRGVQARRPSFWEFEDQLRAMTVPLLVISGDEDDWCLDASVYLKRTAPTAALLVLPKTGHNINQEDPALLNGCLQDFFDTVEAGRWISRDLGTLGKSAFFASEA